MISYIIYFLLGTAICFLVGNKSHRKRIFFLWGTVYTIYFVYAYVGCLYISNPLLDYFISIDEMTFYDISLSLSNYSFTDIWKEAYSDNDYSELPFAAALFGSLHRMANMLGINNTLLFIKGSICLVGSFIPVIIYKIINFVDENGSDSDTGVKSILYFVFLTPLFSFSCQYLRDIHVCFIYTLMFYITIKEQQKGRYILLIVLFLISYGFRVETGLFSALFIFLSIYLHSQNKSKFFRFVLYTLMLVVVLSSFSYVYTIMNDTIEGYLERSIDMAENGSLGVKLNALPVPINYISKMLFGQLLPFPIWMPVANDSPYSSLRFVECFIPLYWIAVVLMLGLCFLKNYSSLDLRYKVIMLFCLLFLLLTSMSEFNPRRMMAVYPILFTVFYNVKTTYSYKMKYFVMNSFLLLLSLHVVYYIIK